jgi:hypothetical protein
MMLFSRGVPHTHLLPSDDERDLEDESELPKESASESDILMIVSNNTHILDTQMQYGPRDVAEATPYC